MIIVVITDPKSAPCVVQRLYQSAMHIETTTWCGKKTRADSLFQMPDNVDRCAACAEKIKTYGA